MESVKRLFLDIWNETSSVSWFINATNHTSEHAMRQLESSFTNDNSSGETLINEGNAFPLVNVTEVGNVTSSGEDTNDDIKLVVDALLLILLVLIMLAMGCEITLQSLWGHIKRPVGLSIGIVSQFGFKPLAAYGLLLLAKIDGVHATGVLITACCPGGVLSNTFTYFSDGDLPLSVAMTTASTIMALGMLPANILLYGSSFESSDVVIPYANMTLSLVVVTSPIVVGMLLRWKRPSVATWVTKVGTYSGLLLMIVCVIIEVCIFPHMFTSVPPELYIVILTLPIIGLVVGYSISAIFKQNTPVCKTIAIECIVQNFPLALTVIALSFPMEVQEEIVIIPILYGVSMVFVCSFLCGIYLIIKKLKEIIPARKVQLTDVKIDLDVVERQELIHSNGVHIQMQAKNGQLMKNGSDIDKV